MRAYWINNLRKEFGFCLSVLILAISLTPTIEAEGGKISGYYIGDFYHVLNSHDENYQGRNGFQYRRIYMNYDREIAKNWSIRLRYEMNSPSFNSGTVGSTKITPYVKHGYVKWTNKNLRLTGYFGLSGTPTFANVEKVWGYRSLAKSPEDLHKLGGSTDFGLSIKGNFDSEKKIGYHAMVGNGKGTKGEDNTGKKGYLSLFVKPTKRLLVEVYGDFESVDDEPSKILTHVFGGYQATIFRLGLLASYRLGAAKKEEKVIAGSLFGSITLIEDKLAFVTRFDQLLNPNPNGKKIAYIPYNSKTTSSTILLALDWRPVNDVQIMPNIVTIVYGKPEKEERPSIDLMPRLTLYYKF